jgi:LmbE family N-acetylglucosaminyl deacetylase
MSKTPAAVDDSMVKIRPHYHLRGHDLFFLASQRPLKRFCSHEKLFFEQLKNTPTGLPYCEIAAKNHSTLAAWVDEGWADILTPWPQTTQHHLVVIEPHMDDAALSVGGQLLRRKGSCHITILCVFGVSNYTSYMESKRAFLDADAITQLRFEESMLAAAKLGAQFVSLGLTDAPLRMQTAPEWSQTFLADDIRASHGFISNHPVPHVVKHIAQVLAQSLKGLNPDEVWIPMGLGNHVDHRTTRAACLHMLSDMQGLKSTLKCRLYEDLPYSRPAHALQIVNAFEAVGSPLRVIAEDISDLMTLKIETVGVFASQFKLPMMAPRLQQAAFEVAQHAGFASAGERSYCLPIDFRIPDELELSVNRDNALHFKAASHAFLLALQPHQSLTVLVLPSGIAGAVPEFTQALNTLFPFKKIRVNLIFEKPQEKKASKTLLVVVEYFYKRSVGTLWLLAKVLTRLRQPLVVVRSEAYPSSRMVQLAFKCLSATRPLLITPSLSDLAAYLTPADEPKGALPKHFIEH